MPAMFCGRLHAWLFARSRLVALFSSLVARRWVGPRALWRLRAGVGGRLAPGVLSGTSGVDPLWFGWWVSSTSELQCCCFCESSFVLSWFWFVCLWDGAFVGWESSAQAKQLNVLWTKSGRGWSTINWLSPLVMKLLAILGAALLFWFLFVLCVVRRFVCGLFILLRLAQWPSTWEIVVHLAAAGNFLVM